MATGMTRLWRRVFFCLPPLGARTGRTAWCLAVVPGITFCLFALHAEQNPFELEEIVVTAGRTMPGESVDSEPHPSFVTIIDTENLAGANLSVPDVLEDRSACRYPTSGKVCSGNGRVFVLVRQRAKEVRDVTRRVSQRVGGGVWILTG